MGKRLVSLDFFRGLMLVVMAIDHLAGAASPTWQLVGFVSAAEGFVFLSGVVIGLVYGKETLKPGPHLRRRSWLRAWKLYRYHLVLLALVMSLAFLVHPIFGAAWRDHMPFLLEHPLTGLALSLTFLNQPRFFDILPLYTLFLLLTPPLLIGFARGRAPLVLGSSVLLWLLAQFDVRHLLLRQAPYYWNLQPGSFDPFAWQLLFVVGCYLGYLTLQGREVVPQGPRPVIIALALALPLLVLRHATRFEWPGFPYVQLEQLTDRASLGWLRVLDFFLVAFLLARLVEFRPQFFRGRWFVFLGQHSLQVFAAHVLFVYLVTPLQWRVLELGLWGLLLAAAFLFLSLSLPALLHERHLERKRQRLSPAKPAGSRLSQASER